MVAGTKARNDQNIIIQNNQNVPPTQNQNFTTGNPGFGISFENQQTFCQQYSFELADICLRFEDLSVRNNNVQSLPSVMCYHIACAAQVIYVMSSTVRSTVCFIACHAVFFYMWFVLCVIGLISIVSDGLVTR